MGSSAPAAKILLIAVVAATAVVTAALYNMFLTHPSSVTTTPGAEPTSREVVIYIYRNYTMSPQIVRAYQGETLVLRISSQVAGMFHLHEPYEAMIEVGPGKISSLTVEAKYAGRVEIELHTDSKEIKIGILEVLPR